MTLSYDVEVKEVESEEALKTLSNAIQTAIKAVIGVESCVEIYTVSDDITNTDVDSDG